MPRRVLIRKVGRGYKGYDFYCKRCRKELRNGGSKLCASCQYESRLLVEREYARKRIEHIIDS